MTRGNYPSPDEIESWAERDRERRDEDIAAEQEERREQESHYYAQLHDDYVERRYEEMLEAEWETMCREETEEELVEALGLDPMRDYGGEG